MLQRKTEHAFDVLPPADGYEFGIFRLLEGEFAGLMFGFDKLEMKDHPDGSGDGMLSFEPLFFNLPEDYDKEKLNSPVLAEIMGDIIYNILVEHIEKTESGQSN